MSAWKRKGWGLAVAAAVGLAACGGEPAEGPRLAMDLLDQGLVDEALRQLRERPPRAEPSRWVGTVARGLERQGRFFSADSLLALHPDLVEGDDRLLYLRGHARNQLGRAEAALADYDAVAGGGEWELSARIESARLRLRLGRAEAALADARRARRLGPEMDGTAVLVVEALLAQGDEVSAREALGRIRELPESPRRPLLLGRAWLAAGEPDSAVAPLEEAVRVAPRQKDAVYQLGRAFLARRQWLLASRALSMMASLDPPYADSQRLWVQALQGLGQTAVADSVQAEWEATQRRRRALALRQAGLAASEAGQGERALDLFEQALTLAPEMADLHNDRGAVLARMDRYAAAEEAFLRARALAPEDPAVHRNLANLFQLTGQAARRDSAVARYRELVASPAP